VFRIGEFSKLGKVTVKTLHHWDEVGLLTPADVDSANGYRYYSVGQLAMVNQIVRLRDLGFSLTEIADLVAGRDMTALIENRRRELLADRRLADRRLQSLDHYIQEMEDHLMKYDVTITTIPACTVFAYDTIVPDYAALGQIMPALGERVAKANPGIRCAPDDYCFNVYPDQEYRDHDVHVEICQAVVERGVDADGIVFKDLPEITAACVTHHGPYEGLAGAFAAVLGWVEANGYRVADHPRESYIDGAWNKSDSADWLTEIQVPIGAA
jgi:DNA-binding transcriptional MerR regulator/predicted transcriptional regulator YdeE